MRKFEKQFRVLRDQIMQSDTLTVESVDTALSEAELRNLQARELICLTPAGNNTFWITLEKRGYYYLDDVADRRTEKLFEWIRYVITTAIALAALAVSIYNLLMQCRP